MPTAEECASIGILQEDAIDNSDCFIWEENWEAFSVFARMKTQWRYSAAGTPTGLDYLLFDKLCERMGVAEEDIGETLDKLQVLEEAAIDKMLESHK